MVKFAQHRYIKNTIANLVGNFLLAAMMFIVTPLLIRLLGDTQYGLFRVALISVVAYASLLDMGLNNAVRRYFAESIHNDNIQQANQVLGIGYRLYFILSGIVIILIFIFLWWLPFWVKAPNELAWPFRWLVLASGLFVSGQFLLCPLRSVMIALDRYDLLQISTVMSRALLFIIGILLLYFWKSTLIAVALSAVIATIATLLLSFFLARAIFPTMAIAWGYRNQVLQKNIFTFGGYGFMIALGPVAVYQTQDALISGFLGPAQVTTYAVAAILMTQMRAVSSAFASPLFPIASKLSADNNLEGIQTLLKNGTRRCLWAWGAIAGPLIVFSGDFISAWVGPEYKYAEMLVWILLLGNLSTTMDNSSTQILTAVGSIKWMGYSQIIMTVAAIATITLLLGPLGKGLISVAWAISIALVFRSGLSVPFYACRQLRMPPIQFFAYSLLPLLLFLCFSTGTSWLFSLFFHPHSLLMIVLSLLTLILLNGGAGLFFMFNAKQRKALWMRKIIKSL